MGRVATHDMGLLERLALPETGRLVEELLLIEDEIEAARGPLAARLHRLIPAIEDRGLRRRALELKRAVVNSWEPWSSSEEGALDESARQDAARLRLRLAQRRALLERAGARFEAEFARARAELVRLLQEPFVLEGIELSSADMLEAAKRYVQDSPGAAGAAKWQRALERSVSAHLSRACAKTSPRATLTAVHPGVWDDELAPPARSRPRSGRPILRRRTMIGLPVARQIVRKVTAGLWRHVVPRPNPTLALDAGHVTFWKPVGKDEVQYRLPSSQALLTLLELSEPRRLRADALLDAAVARLPEYAPPELEAYYLKLGELGVIRAELEIPAGEQDGLDFLIRWLEGLPSGAAPAAELEALRALRAALQRLDAPDAAASERAARQREAMTLLSRYTAHAMAPAQALIVDAVSDWDLALGPSLKRELSAAVALFEWLGDNGSGNAMARTLARRLRGEFPDAEEIPVLATYLEKPSGEAAPSGAAPYSSARGKAASGSRYEARLEAFRRLVLERLAPGGREARLGHEDLALLRGSEPAAASVDRRPGFGAFYCHVARSPDGPQEDFRVVGEFLPGDVTRAFSRWAPLLEPHGAAGRLEEKIERLYRGLDAPAGSEWAGVIFQGRGKTETAGWVPSYHRYEVETLGAPSSLPRERALSLKDLFFRLGPGDELSVWRRRPDGGASRLLTQYHGLVSARDQPMVRLMDYAGRELERLLGFADPSQALLDQRFGDLPLHCPRLLLGRFVLARETWMLRAAHAREFDSKDPWESALRYNRWRRRRGMPRFVFAHCGVATHMPKPARPVVVDAYNPFLVDGLVAELRACADDAELRIVEMLPAPDELWTRRHERRYAQEIALAVRFQRKD